MSFSLEYDVSVRRSSPASVAFLLLLPFIISAHAQLNGKPSSAISPPLVGRGVNPPTGVTSIGPNAHSQNSRAPLSTSNVPRDDNRHTHRHHHAEDGLPLVYAVPVPYAVDMGATDGATDNNADDSADDNYQGGPTIFDRRGSGADSYVPPVRDVPPPHSGQTGDVSVAASDPPQAPTLLVFKDARKLEVGNYAIVGQTLFDLTPGHARKIALADLDLEATRRQNEDRGVTFQLPAPSQGN
jgi:hypothetical protein